MPGLLYLLGYLVVVPLVVTFPPTCCCNGGPDVEASCWREGEAIVHNVKPVWRLSRCLLSTTAGKLYDHILPGNRLEPQITLHALPRTIGLPGGEK